MDIGEVARRAGVSRSTVSYALSGKRPVSAHTRQRVHAVIAEVGYRPSATARALRAGRTDTMALLIPRAGPTLKPSHLPFVAALVEAGERCGLDVLMSAAAVDGSQQHLARLVDERRVDGVVVMDTTAPDPVVELLHRLGATFVTIGRTGNPHHDWVDVDQHEAVLACTRHLTGLGHRRLALVTGDQARTQAGYGPAIYSEQGFRLGLAAAGATGTVHGCGDSAADGTALGRQLLALPEPPTGLVVINDGALSGLGTAIADAGLSVPSDVSVTAMLVRDALPAGVGLPDLTGVDVPVQQMAAAAVAALSVRLLGLDSSAVGRLLPAQLVARASTAPPPSARTTR